MDKTIRDRGYVYFLSEAPELLASVEDGLLHLHERSRVQNVHSLMRATHTLKGAAANVGIDALKTISHSMEDAFKALYNEDIEIDTELEKLLFEGYECLRVRLTAEISQTAIDDEELLDRAAEIFAKMREKLGDDFGQKEYIPTSAELGFDIAQSIFELGVKQRLDELETALAGSDDNAVAQSLQASAEVFVGLGESLNLPGWGEIAQMVLKALTRPNPNPREIAEVALVDYRQGHAAVLNGDRESGGRASAALKALAGEAPEPPAESEVETRKPNQNDSRESSQTASILEPIPDTVLEVELEQFREFLGDRRYGRPLVRSVQDFFCQTICAVSRWFAQTEAIPPANFCFELMVTKLPARAANHKKTVIRTVSGLKKWVEGFLEFIDDPSDSESLRVYRHWTLLSVVVFVAKFQYRSDTQQPKTYRDVMLVEALRRLNKAVGDRYSQLPPVSAAEKDWLQLPHLAKLNEPLAVVDSDEDEVESVWGSLDENDSSDFDEPEASLTPNAPAVADLPDESSDTDPNESSWQDDSTTPSAESAAELSQTQENPPSQTESDEPSSEPSRTAEAFAQRFREPNASRTETEIANAAPEVIEEHVNEGEFFEDPPVDTVAKPSASSQSDRGTNETSRTAEPRQLVSVDIKGLERLNHRLGELLVDRNRQALEEEALRQSATELRSQIHQHRDTISQLLDWSERTLAVMGRAADDFSNAPNATQQILSLAGNDNFDFNSIADLHLLLKTAFGEAAQLDRNSEEVYSRSRELAQLMEKQQQLLSVMQDDLVDVRMLPLGEILQRFPLMVQQLARIQGKPVNLDIVGGDLLVEQSIAQKLYEPLLHLVRNAFDHGIESVEDRRKQGKPDVGTISIRAYNQGVQTTIEVRDDGRGLDLAWIRRKAVEGQFLTEEEASQIVSTDRLEVLFEPGFSTASQVSEISGRGVGLDVVRSQLQALKGKIAVESQPGEGTVFVLQIPLSITIAKLLVVQAGGSAYALLLDSIDKIVMPPPDTLKHFENHKVLQMEGEGETRTMVSVRQLADLLHYRSSLVSSGEEPTTNKMSIARDLSAPILLLRHNNRQVGLEVDRIIGEQELVIRPLGRAIAPPPYIYGCSILSDSRLALVLDGGEIVEQSATPALNLTQSRVMHPSASSRDTSPALSAAVRASLPSSSPPPAAQPTAKKTTLLVVDDSINLRHTLTATLMDAGYEVLQARDGQEAIAQLQDHPEIEFTFCDVEMPHMNGFEFLSYCRQAEGLSQLPIVMLTSHSSPKYRQIAKELGATDYLTKPFSETELLGVLQSLT